MSKENRQVELHARTPFVVAGELEHHSDLLSAAG